MPWELEDLDAPGPARVLSINAIDEDPDQPRREFDATTLHELAETIKARGVRQPVSVRPHPTQPGRWILNFGARRLRASKLAGKTEIPVFIDKELGTYDQVIENEQRDALRPLELAMFIERQLERGQSRIDIARGIGKSAPYVTYACALIDAPDWLMELYRSGRCGGLRELYELRRLHDQDATTVHAWLAGGETVSRDAIQRLKECFSLQPAEPVAGSIAAGTAGSTDALASKVGRPGFKPSKSTGTTVTLPMPDEHLTSSSPSSESAAHRTLQGMPERSDVEETNYLTDEVTAVLAFIERLVDSLKASTEPGHAAALLTIRRQLVLLARR